MERIPLDMVRPTLEGIPQFPLPEPFSIRPYRQGDAETWLAIHRDADAYGTFPPHRFPNEFGTDDALLAERQLYLCDGAGRAIGTTTAWFNDDYERQRFGRIHWVAIVPAFQGRGLANPLLSRACQRLVELGHDRAYLDTATVRTAALNLYLKFGFVPHLRRPRCVAGWRLVRPFIRPEYWRKAVEAVPELAGGSPT